MRGVNAGRRFDALLQEKYREKSAIELQSRLFNSILCRDRVL
jgi:hypothetical protein